MPRQRRLRPQTIDASLDPFALEVERALEHFGDSEWLGNHSPLAAPYFLGQALDVSTQGQEAAQRGQALQRVLLQAAGGLEDELRKLLQITYFERDPRLDNVALTLSLHLSERTFYRLRQRALQALALTLNHSLLPPLRSEIPALQNMVGREAVLAMVLEAVQSRRSVSLSGPSGIGKTTLGTVVAHRWSLLPGEAPASRVFWYTLRNGFNDQLASLLFALSYFLHNLGAFSTWRQLVADRGIPNLERVLALLRHDLTHLNTAPPLICIDEVDALQDEIGDHVQIAHLLEALTALCPVLLIGQRIILDTQEQIRLTGLSEPELGQLICLPPPGSAAPVLSTEQQQQLYRFTRGNPSLILLFATLVRNGDEPAGALQALAKSPSLEGLFNRLWRRLNEAERDCLLQLAVFRNPTPAEAWQDRQPLLERLIQRGLVQPVSQGGVQMPPHFQKLAYERIPAELRPRLHLRAMQIRETRAEHLAAMYHAIEGGKTEWAIWHWFAHRDDEIERGQGAKALELLRRISPSGLGNERDRTTLHLARAHLLNLAGQVEEAELELQATSTAAKSSSRAFARRLEGHVLEFQGRVDQALEKYREALEALAGLPQYHEVLTHSRLSFLQLYRLSNVEQARKEALLARAKADAFLGDIEAMAGRYESAIEYLLSAERHAGQHGRDLATLSKIYSYLGVVHVKLGEFDTAIGYIDKAIDCDRQRGDEVGPLYDLMNRSTAHTMAGRYEQGYEDAQQGLKKAKRLRQRYLMAGLAACAAEACHGLQRWEEAEAFADYALNQEEEFFRAPTLLVLSRIRLAQSRYAECLSLLTTALESAQGVEDRYTEAMIWKWMGTAWQAQGLNEAARSAYEASLQIYGDLNLPREVSRLQAQLQTVS